MKITKWIPCTTSPTHTGEYEFRANGKFFKSRSDISSRYVAPIIPVIWNGEKFIPRPPERRMGEALNYFPESFEWRGLAEKP